MTYMYWTVDLDEGDQIEISIDQAANVMVMRPSAFQNFQSGKAYTYHGGYYNQTPVILKPRGTGRQHVVVENPHGGEIGASVLVRSK